MAPDGLKVRLMVDTSQYQHPNGEVIDWVQVAGAGITHALVRYGDPAKDSAWLATDMHERVQREMDPWFVRDVQGARAAGIKVGTYAWIRPTMDTPEGQMQRIYDAIMGSVGRLDLPYMFDVETEGTSSWPLPYTATVWLEQAHAKMWQLDGREPFLYNAQWFYANKMTRSEYLSKCKTFIASYRNVAPDDEGVMQVAGFVDWAYKNPQLLQSSTPSMWQTFGWDAGPLQAA